MTDLDILRVAKLRAASLIEESKLWLELGPRRFRWYETMLKAMARQMLKNSNISAEDKAFLEQVVPIYKPEGVSVSLLRQVYSKMAQDPEVVSILAELNEAIEKSRGLDDN